MTVANEIENPITTAIDRLRHLTQTSVQANWRCCFEDLTVTEVGTLNWRSQPLALSNAKDHLAWSKGRQVLWLYQQFVLPAQLQHYPLSSLTLRLALTWWAELAQIYVNGCLVQEGDLFDHSTRIVLSDVVTPGAVITVAMRLISPGHDDGALVKSRLLYESADDRCDPGFVADELAVLQSYLTAFAPEALATVETAIADLDWAAVSDRPSFDRSLETLRHTLLCFSDQIKQHTIYLVGHAHLDLAWLWPVAETWSVAERTFRSVLHLQKDFPELTFCHSTPALYEWMEQHRPDLFVQIQAQVQAGRWEVAGGLWVEPELNMIGAEAIARHLLYGQRYCQAKFGAINRIAWLPDSFGFCWQLPQLLKQGGIDYFVTQKLRWNDTTQFPYEVFGWRSPDGTAIGSLMSAPIGEGIDPIKLATYTWDWVQKTGITRALWLPGVGDHGGGPTRDMLELARRWQTSPFFPQLVFTQTLDYLDRYIQPLLPSIAPSSREPLHQPVAVSSLSALPEWNSELYLEFHRGCYTTHADQKRFNRKGEALLYQAELWAALATIATGQPYPQAALETAWKKVLFNQFHDILPGSSIPQVFVDANQDWQAVAAISSEILHAAHRSIAEQIAFPAPPHPHAQAIVVFNPSNWTRTQVVWIQASPMPETVDPSEVKSWQICDLNGKQIELQHSLPGQPPKKNAEIAFLATDVPAIGYRGFWLCPCDSQFSTSQFPSLQPTAETFLIENEFLRVVIDSATGDLATVFDKVHHREVLNGAGNQLQAFRDQGQYWDAWNIDPNYAEHPLPPAKLTRIAYFENWQGQLHKAVEVDRTIGNSSFQQTYCLEANSPVLKIFTTVADWQERHVMVKAAFPLNLEADYATYEMPAGAIQRSTKPQTAQEKAQWEVPAMQWADLSDSSYGVSLLNDCKYGYDCQPNQIRLTLLRGSQFPDADADRGKHTFTYALYPHSGNWQAAVRQGYELNQPLQAVHLAQPPIGTLPPIGSLLDLGEENLVLTAMKQSEADSETYILRCYECHGETAELSLSSDLGLQLEQRVDLLEREITENTALISPWQIASFKIGRSPTLESP